MEQTVHRAASLLPENAPVAVHHAHVSLVPPAALLESALPLIPVRSARELAVGLARQWRDWSGADSAVVIFGFPRERRRFVCQAVDNELPRVDESDYEPNQADHDFAQIALPKAAGFFREAKPSALVRFPSVEGAVGCAVLYSADRLDLPAEPCESLAALSGRLVEQAALVEAQAQEQKAIEAAKIDALAEFAAAAGHEINNPLATITGRAQILLRDEAEGNRRHHLATIGAQALRVRDMIGDLMLFARPPAPAPERLLLNAVAEAVLDGLKEVAVSQSCRIALVAPGPVFATADPTQARIVLSELVRNSLEALEPPFEGSRPQIVLRLERATLRSKSGAVATVVDNGPGLTEKDRAHLFDPFYSGRDAGRGLGFGLCKCWRIIEGHGGSIEVDSVPRVATTFRVFWPDEPSRPHVQF